MLVKGLFMLLDAFNNHLSEDNIMYDTSSREKSFCECPDDCRNQKYVAKLKVHNL